uniref:Centromere protein K n=2 Tax=Denticeps clupeoides TaxID=299321 RepID=A0AAY4EYJ0_9TELE
MSEAAKADLLDECEKQFCLLQKLQNAVLSADAESCEDTDKSPDHFSAVLAEVEQWQELEPRFMSNNPEILSAVGREEMKRQNAQLQMAVSFWQAKRDTLRNTVKREKTLLEEKEAMLSSVSEKVASLQLENSQLSEHSVLQDMKRRIQKVKDYQSSLLETLSEMLAEHFPLPDPGGITDRTKLAEPDMDLMPLNEILELLTNKTLETPHEPYVSIDDRFWPPYIELLLRNGIAVRHQENCNKVRLENFF